MISISTMIAGPSDILWPETGSWLLEPKGAYLAFRARRSGCIREAAQCDADEEASGEEPDIDTDKPVSRQHEALYFDYYGYPYYWGGDYLWGPMAYPRLSKADLRRDEEARVKREAAYDSHLRSANRVTGYHIEATDGDIGHVEDFIIDGETWEIRYMVVDTQNWWPGKKVLVAPQWNDRVSWDDSKVYVDLSRETIKNGPEYRPETLDRKYEETLYDYYKRPKYWEIVRLTTDPASVVISDRQPIRMKTHVRRSAASKGTFRHGGHTPCSGCDLSRMGPPCRKGLCDRNLQRLEHNRNASGQKGEWILVYRRAGAKAGDEYRYLIHAPPDWNLPPLSRIDPYARNVTSSVGNGVIYDPKAFDWGDDAFRMATGNELVIYEMHIGTFYVKRRGTTGHAG